MVRVAPNAVIKTPNEICGRCSGKTTMQSMHDGARTTTDQVGDDEGRPWVTVCAVPNAVVKIPNEIWYGEKKQRGESTMV